MSYVERTLADGETIRFKARLHWIIWVRAWTALILLGIVVVGLVIFVRDLIFLTTTEVAITNRRLIKKTGWLDRHTSELELSSVEAVNLDQSVWGRMLGFGRVNIHGTGDDVWNSPLIATPVRFRRELESALSSSPQAAAPNAARARPASRAV
jgi:uncharacterized membrane protein YdbT with pleckstrin-like domain